MNVLIQFDESGEYKDGAWKRPVSYRKGEVHSVSPLSAIVLIEQQKAHIYNKNTDEPLDDLDEV
ncbi:hypothetical protein GCM10007938_07960 [Vibrio zhanjiangensis]|uniref:Uncharacterized protein n=1 Tax=Vibrio zhanjiangensis TaxID=1046128 RepID=A0ABQ6EVK1_9VIBR|nr:hypothetical protein [Vibrio zhanjiangensis]GLT17019.1 hypothetical protein GCM10007938_07960 [Vibrio zhanjiangensis]